ncbi:hypothetical protein EDC96DRAFT_566168 [Choanephora cucurbitarum]|nr:hypothetical protein EDC96DRAFT_566168 [Choanephora cucurbitarum]
MSQSDQTMFALILSKLDEMNEHLQRLENQANVVKDVERRGASVIPFPSYLDEQRGKMKKLIVSTELIKKALEDAEGIENTEVAYKIFQQACFTQASDMVHRVYLNKPVSWPKVNMSFRLNAVDKADASINAITKYDPANFEDDWAVSHLVRRAYFNKCNYYTKLVKEGMSSLAKEVPSEEAPEQDEIDDTSSEGSEPSSSEDEEEVPVSRKRKSVSSPVPLGLSKKRAPVKKTKASLKKAAGGSKAKRTSK